MIVCVSQWLDFYRSKSTLRTHYIQELTAIQFPATRKGRKRQPDFWLTPPRPLHHHSSIGSNSLSYSGRGRGGRKVVYHVPFFFIPRHIHMPQKGLSTGRKRAITRATSSSLFSLFSLFFPFIPFSLSSRSNLNTLSSPDLTVFPHHYSIFLIPFFPLSFSFPSLSLQLRSCSLSLSLFSCSHPHHIAIRTPPKQTQVRMAWTSVRPSSSLPCLSLFLPRFRPFEHPSYPPSLLLLLPHSSVFLVSSLP